MFAASKISRTLPRRILAAAVLPLLIPVNAAIAEDVSAPVMLQFFDSSWKNLETRAPDMFKSGFGGIWTPPPGRADTGNQSVGYDVYDRFDLGSPGNPTLYGTKTGLKTAIGEMRKIGATFYTDLVWNHNGYSNLGTSGFTAAGGYPGVAIQLQNTNPANPGYNSQGYNNVDGDFHSSFAGGDWEGRLAGLIDIAQERNYQFVRNPVPGFANNLPAGTTPLFGRLANVPTESNRQFYPDRQGPKITVFDPALNQTVDLYEFNGANPLQGDPVEENALGYLMRQTQWMVQEVGVDGFRMDATKHMPQWVLNYYDRAVWKADKRPLLDGSQRYVYGFGEYFDGNKAAIQSTIRKDLNLGTSQIRGNRDALDFPLFFAMRDNLTGNGFNNDWRNVVNASQDLQDDGLANNGSQSVAFVSSHDNDGAYLSSVAHAFMLMRPGNAVIYFNGHEFGDSASRPFPKDGRQDALGGLYGNTITKLVNIRNTHGRGNFANRTPTADAKEMLIYERQNAALVVLSNRMDGGYDSRTVQTSFPAGTPLLELTGNSSDATIDPFNDFPEVVIVNGDGTVNLRVPRNKSANNVEHGRGYFIYGPSGPQGSLSLTNVAQTLAGGTPTASSNGTTRLANVKVVTVNSFDLTLNTNLVNLIGFIRDHDADGDNALFRIDGGIDANGNGVVDFVAPGSVTYGYEAFTTVNTPGYTSVNNNGTYTQSINAANLSEGYHHLTARAFRKRSGGEPAIFTDFKETIYVDRLKPVSSVLSFEPWNVNNSQNRDLIIQSDDKTAQTVQVLINQPANRTDAQILADVGTSNWLAGQIDRDQFKYGFFNVASGNQVFTIVTKEITGNFNIQRIVGQNYTTSIGLGLGDLNFDGAYAVGDVGGTAYGMEAIVYPNGSGTTNFAFNPAADLDANGLIDSRDLYALRARYDAVGAAQAVKDAAQNAILRRGDVNGNHTSAADAADIDHLYANLGSLLWNFDLDVDGWPTPSGADQQDVDVLVRTIFQTEYGDTNLDRIIDFDDYVNIDNGFNNELPGWANGDFDGNGFIDFDDYVIIDSAFNQQGLSIASALDWLEGEDRSALKHSIPGVGIVAEHFEKFGTEYVNAFYASVPEPTSAGATALALAALLQRNRKQVKRGAL